MLCYSDYCITFQKIAHVEWFNSAYDHNSLCNSIMNDVVNANPLENIIIKPNGK